MRYVLKHGYLQQMKTRVTKQIKRQSKKYLKKNQIHHSFNYRSHILSVPSVRSLTFDDFVQNTSTCQGSTILKSMKGEKSKISSLARHLFLPGKITGTKTDFLRIFIIGKYDIFSRSKVTWNTSFYFSTLSSG